MAFGKRGLAAQDNLNVMPEQTKRVVGTMPQAGCLVGKVIVRQSAYDAYRSGKDDYALVQAVVDFVNTSMELGYYTRQELPDKAMQAYHADYYLAQVNNGGHSQFIHNSGEAAPFVYADARAGLSAMGAPHLQQLQAMIDWIASNPDEAEEQDGFKNRAGFLAGLDEALYACEKHTPMIGLSSRWISGWHELTVVQDDQLATAFENIAQMNPRREQRKDLRRLNHFVHDMSQPIRLACGMAAASAEPREAFLGVGAGASEKIDGEDVTCFSVMTTHGKRRLAILPNAVALYEYIDPDADRRQADMANLGMDESWKRFRDGAYAEARIGRKISQVATERISELGLVTAKHNAAAAMWLLFKKSGLQAEDVAITPLSMDCSSESEKRIVWFVISGDEGYHFVSSEQGSFLKRPDDEEPLATVTRAETLAALEAADF